MVINPIVGVYIPIITIPIKGEMTIPNIGSLDPGTYVKYAKQSHEPRIKPGPWLFAVFVGDEKLPSYMGIILNHYKDPY